MRWALVIALAGLGLATPAGAAPRAVGCNSGVTEHEERGVRMFGAYRGEDLGLYACTGRNPRPVHLWEVSPGTTSALSVQGRTGSRLALSFEEFADEGNGVWVGWFDVRTRRSALREVRGPSTRPDPEEEGSGFTPHPDAVAVGRDGSLAYAFEAGGATYEVFRRAPAGRGLARRERRVAQVAAADFEPLSLRSARGSVVTWRTRGVERSAPLAAPAAPPPVAATPAARRRGCNGGAGLFNDATARAFAVKGGVFACRLARGARAVRLAPARARLSLFARAPGVLGFLARDGRRVSAGSLALRSGALRRRSIGGPAPSALAVGADGGVAFVRAAGAERTLTHLAVEGARFGAPRELARVAAGELDPATLKLTASAATWRTVGEPRRVRGG